MHIIWKGFKLYERRTDTMSQHIQSRALVTSSKFGHSYSSHRGGTTEYLNSIDINLGLVSIRHAWYTTEAGDD